MKNPASVNQSMVNCVCFYALIRAGLAREAEGTVPRRIEMDKGQRCKRILFHLDSRWVDPQSFDDLCQRPAKLIAANGADQRRLFPKPCDSRQYIGGRAAGILFK